MNKRWPLIASFVLFVVLCVSAAYWALQLFQPPPRPVAAPPRAAAPEIRPQAAAALFGGRANVAVASNYKLHGVIFAGNPRDSVAILSADGKPAQAIRAGSEVVPGVTVKEVHRGHVLLAEGGAVKRVDLPEEAEQQANGAVRAPVPARPVAPTPPPPAPPPAAAPPAPSAPPQAPDAAPEPEQQGVPGAAAAARGQREFPQSQPSPDGTNGQQAPAQFAPATPSSVVVNPGGGVATETPPPPGN